MVSFHYPLKMTSFRAPLKGEFSNLTRDLNHEILLLCCVSTYTTLKFIAKRGFLLLVIEMHLIN